jgi:hypothetical protein
MMSSNLKHFSSSVAGTLTERVMGLRMARFVPFGCDGPIAEEYCPFRQLKCVSGAKPPTAV